jgi:ribosomal protein S18 acetylase RimI-like enzyme
MENYKLQSDNFSPADIDQAVKIHRQEIGQGFLSSLGDKALELIFSLAASSDAGVLFLARDESKTICGFLLGTINTGRFYKHFLLTKSVPAMLYLAPKMISIERIRKVMETLLYPSKKDSDRYPDAELLDIAVLKEKQGTGLAQQLFYAFVEHLRQKGIGEFKITTGETLIRAQKFYEKLGACKVASIEVHKGQKTYIYLYQVTPIK